MIVACNNNIITEIHYNDYLITKIYGCDDNLVWEYERPTPATPIARYTVNGSSDWLEIGDDNGDSAVTSGEVSHWVTNTEFNNMDYLFFYANCKEIGNRSFSGCGVQHVSSWGTVTRIGKYAFYGCDKLQDIYECCCNMVIDNYAFSGCTSLVSVKIGVTDVNLGAFSSCSALTTAHVAANTIGDYAFWNCRSLSSLTLGNNVTIINSSSFSSCDLRTVTIPASVTKIGTSGFYGNLYMEKFVFEGTTPPTVTSTTFGSTNNCPIVIPWNVSKTDWASATGWSTYVNRLKYDYEV